MLRRPLNLREKRITENICADFNFVSLGSGESELNAAFDFF